MSDPNDRAFDVYLARGSNLSQRYRDEATDKPSAAIDSLILTASRRAKVSLSEMPVQPWYKRWRVPIAFAAVLVLGVGVALRTVLQESNLGAPPPLAPAAKSESTPPPAAPAMESADQKATAPAEPVGAVSSGTIAAPIDLGAATKNDLEKKKSGEPEEIVVEQESAQALPPAATTEERSIAETPAPKPKATAPAGKGAMEGQAGSGSPGALLDEAEAPRRLEQDTQVEKSVAESQRPDDLARGRDQAPPEASQEAPPPLAAPASPPVAGDAKILPVPGDGPRLPEGHPPIVDGKTFRANSAAAKRQAEEPKKQHAATIVDDVTEAPEAWLRRVAELRRLGRNDEANAELERFRQRYPDYPVPLENR